MQFLVVGRHKRILFHTSAQVAASADVVVNIQRHKAIVGAQNSSAVAETAANHSRIVDSLNVDVGNHQLLVGAESLAHVNHFAHLSHDGITGKNEVGSGFAVATRRIDICRQAAARLMTNELHQTVVLAHKLVGCREVDNHVGAIHCSLCAWRQRRPQVFADFASHFGIANGKQHIAAKRHLAVANHNRSLGRQRGRRSKPSLLVELSIVGNIGFGYYSHHLAAANHHSAVI